MSPNLNPDPLHAARSLSPRARRIVKAAAIAFALALVGWRVYVASTFRPAKNFHEIDPGRYYRSAQLTGDEFAEAIRAYGIKTIINLRGAGAGEAWYDDEERAARENGAKLLNFGFSTKHVPHRSSLLPLLDALRAAARPILVHCRSGADRTGEVSAIYEMLYMGKSKEEALGQLSWRYLYVEPFAPAKRLFVEDWQGEEWAKRAYDPCIPKYAPYYEHAGNNCPTIFPPAEKASPSQESQRLSPSTSAPDVART
jgi:protein tyrosine/serine phosphatase